MKYKIGIDVGVLSPIFFWRMKTGKTEIYKVLSTPDDPSIGLINGLTVMAQGKGMDLAQFVKHVDIIVHGTTVTTNAVLTYKGAKTGLLTTEGLRDALEMRRGIRERAVQQQVRECETPGGTVSADAHRRETRL